MATQKNEADREPQTAPDTATGGPGPLPAAVSVTGTVAAGDPGTEIEQRLQAAEEGRRTAELRFHNTVERVADGILVVDGEGTIRFINPAGERILGRPADRLIGTDLGVPLVTGETTQVDLHTPAGARVAELRIAETSWEDADALLISVRDITERRDAEERERQLLREQMARLQAEESAARARVLAEASRLLVASLDQDTILSDLAKLAAETIGDHCLIDVSTDLGPGRYRKIVASRRPEGDAEIVVCVETAGPPLPSPLARRVYESRRAERVVDPGPEWIEDACFEPEDRELWRSFHPAVVVVAPLLTSSGALGILAVTSSRTARGLADPDEALVADLAHRTSLALENTRLLRLAEEASRAKSDFLAIVSHELRTPLTGITGYAGLLMEELERPLTNRERSYVDGILRSADRLLRIIDQILLFARSRSGRDEVRYRPIRLSGLIEEVAAVVRPLAKEAGLRLDVHAPPPEIRVNTDAEIVRHILLHLLTNAIKFTDTGTITLEADLREGVAVLRVSDTGRGIPPDKIDRIFEPFSQAEEPHTRAIGGTGLGLSVVKNLVRSLGGDIHVASDPERGSTFTVRLPQPDPAES
jgi:signal transduction histidine kinase